jgi:hypothetical protein
VQAHQLCAAMGGQEGGIMRSLKSAIYRGLRASNDYSAVRRSAASGSPRPLVMRGVRRVYGRAASKGFRLFR